MADLTGTSVAANYRKNVINNSGVGREFIVSITADAATLTDAKLNEAIDYFTVNNYTSANTDGSSACTVGGLGTADGTDFDPTADTVVYLRLQTTQDLDVTDFNAAQANTTAAIVCEFKPQHIGATA